MSQRGLTGRSPAMSVTRIFLRRSACFRSLCGAIFFLCDTSPLSADDDALRIKSKCPARGLGLSLESLPNKQVSPVQISVDDSATGIALSWRVVPCVETAGDSLLLAVMELAFVEMMSTLTLSPGNLLSMHRGYVSGPLPELARKAGRRVASTSPAKFAGDVQTTRIQTWLSIHFPVRAE
jgi:hypothetical protein